MYNCINWMCCSSTFEIQAHKAGCSITRYSSAHSFNPLVSSKSEHNLSSQVFLQVWSDNKVWIFRLTYWILWFFEKWNMLIFHLNFSDIFCPSKIPLTKCDQGWVWKWFNFSVQETRKSYSQIHNSFRIQISVLANPERRRYSHCWA